MLLIFKKTYLYPQDMCVILLILLLYQYIPLCLMMARVDGWHALPMYDAKGQFTTNEVILSIQYVDMESM